MATQLREKPAGSGNKHESFITAQLSRTEQRIRLLDLAAALAGFLAGTLAYAVLMILLDRQFVLADGSRQLGLLVYFLAAGGYLYLAVVRPLRRRVNPYYAARQLEQTLPGTKNHVINWIDLHDENLPGVIRTALGQRAAKDLSKADVEQAISSRRALVWGGVAGLFLGLFIVLFLLFGPRPFSSLLGRAFAPFGAGGIATRTQVSILRPDGGNATATIGHSITIVARIDGRVPDAHAKDAPRLLYRHEASENYRERFLQRDDSVADGREWAATVAPLDVGNGFFYKVAAGDDETPEYQVRVRAAPLIADFEAKYQPRPYTLRATRTDTKRKLEDLRGTEVQILARTNRAVRDGQLEFQGSDNLLMSARAEVRPDDPQTLRFRFVLDQSGKYRIRFQSIEGEAYIDQTSYEVNVQLDLAPQVKLTDPGKDVTVPLDGQQEIKGEASDDFGIAAVSLQMQIVGGKKLQPKAYMADQLGKPGFGTPQQVNYRDLIVLQQLKDESGKPAELRPGMVIEYWLEARDGCDYPKANVGTSQHYKITVGEASNSPEQKKQQEAARKQQEKHEKEQGEKAKKEEAERKAQKEKEDAQEKEDAKKRDQERGKKGKENDKKKPNPEEKDNKGDKGDKGDKDGKDAKQQEQEDKTRKEAEKLQDALARNERKPGESKGDGEQKPGENKDAGEKKQPGVGKDEGENKAKPEDKGENKPGEKKDAGNGDKQGEARDEGKKDPTDMKGGEKKGEGKEGGKQGQQGGQPGEPKPGEKNQARPGQPKDAGKDGAGKAGEQKPDGDKKPGDNKGQGEAKDSKNAGKPGEQGQPGEKKDGGGKPSGEKKAEGKQGQKSGEKSGEAKPNPSQNAAGKPGACKECQGGGKAGADGTKPGEGKGKGQLRPAPENANANDVRDVAEDLKKLEGKARADAKRDLKDIQEQAKDADARQAAKAALDEAKEAEQPGKARPAPGKDGEKPGESKEGGDKDGMGMGKDGDMAMGMGDGAKPGQEGMGKTKGSGQGDATDNPGDGTAGDRDLSGGGSGGGKATAATKEKPEAHRPSMLQLEDFRKKVDPNVLRDAKMSKEQYEKFLRDYAELVRQLPKTDDKEVIPPAGRNGGTLGSMVGKPSKPSDRKPDDLRNEGKPKPPPEYREAHNDFLQRLLKPGR